LLLNNSGKVFEAGESGTLPGEVIRGPKGEFALRVRIRGFEEKGSDVNLASNLIADATHG